MKHTILSLIFLMSFAAFAQTAAPTDLTASVKKGMMGPVVELNWNYDTTVSFVKYNVYKTGTFMSDSLPHFVRIATLGRTSFVDYHVSPDSKVSYYVTAVVGETESSPSNTVDVTIQAPPPPPAPTFAKITGSVTEDGSAAPVFRAYVQIWASDPMTRNFVSVMTDSFGNFTARLNAGTYYMWTGARGYVPEFFDNSATKEGATQITVADGDSLTVAIGLVKVVPPVVYTVQGSVLNESGAPVKAEVTAFSVKERGPECGFNFPAHTDSLGNYTIKVKENDSLVVYATTFNRDLKPQFYNDKETFATADIVVVTASVTGINFILHPRPVYDNGISGTVLDSAGTTVPQHAKVFIYRKSFNHNAHRKGVLVDSLTGAYSFTNLEPGVYILSAQAPGYKPTYYTASGTQTFDWRQADSIVVTETGVVENVNFNLLSRPAPEGNAVVYGFVKGDNAVVDGAINYIVDASGKYVDYSTSDIDGSYYITSAGTGTYSLVSSLVNYIDTKTSVVFEQTGTRVTKVDVNLTPASVTGINDKAVVTEYALNQNYPNPFNPTTVISYSIPQNTLVSLKVYNILGKEVATLVNEQQSAGQHLVTFNASNLASGVYLYKIQAGSFSSVKKLTLIK